MASRWTVAPETDRYELAVDGDAFWIEIKRELTVGEQKRADLSGFNRVVMPGREQRQAGADGQDGQEIAIDWRRQAFVRMETYLVDWSLQDERGNKLAIHETLEHLRQPVYDAIEQAINAHVESRRAAKNIPATGAPEPSSSSVS